MGCLALNASFEPLTIIPIRRAIRLVIDGKAEALELDASRPIRSESLQMDTPVVIRLVRFIHVPRRFRRQVTNTFLFARDGYTCQYCGRHRRDLGYRESLTRDHVTPISRGGDNGWSNVVTACSKCNLRKADRMLTESGMRLRSAPSEPNHVELIWAVRSVTPIQARYIRMFYGEDVLRALSH
ncbi:MAG: HNH endonuclease [Gemmatimonadota bacterium]|nr:HNH endonuclease [Gemmatimonadota bacterium]